MKFILNGNIKFSGNVEEASADIESFIKEANEVLLKKGLGNAEASAGSKITNWEIDNDKLIIEIESGYKIRAHDGLIRLKKPLGQLLGKKYHIGVRNLHIDQYEVKIPLGNDEYQFDLENAKKLDYELSNISIDKDTASFTINNIDESEIKKQSINRIIKFVSKKQEDLDLTYTATKSTPGEIVNKSPEFKTYFKGDVTETAVEKGWIKKFPGKGQWFYGPQMTALQRCFEEIFIEKIIDKLDFQECLFPKLIPLEVMEKMKYLEGLPEGMYYCSAPKRDPEMFEKFKNDLIINKEIPIDLLKKGLKDPGYVIAAAQCEPFYQFFSHEVIDESEMPIKFFDKSGWTYRWEGGGSKGFDRVNEFQRIEFVWLGIPEDVEKIRDATVQLSYDIANELELEWYTEIGDDPFYLEGRKVETRSIEFPDVPKYEMRLKIPGQEKGVAVISANVHGTHFVEGFSIKEAHQHRIWTGCTGIGLTRWLFGFLAQKGFDKENWPKLVQDKIKDVKMPKILTWPK